MSIPPTALGAIWPGIVPGDIPTREYSAPRGLEASVAGRVGVGAFGDDESPLDSESPETRRRPAGARQLTISRCNRPSHTANQSRQRRKPPPPAAPPHPH
jgi:hypothetical protein